MEDEDVPVHSGSDRTSSRNRDMLCFSAIPFHDTLAQLTESGKGVFDGGAWTSWGDDSRAELSG